MVSEHAVEQLTREQLMRRVNFDRRALHALARVYEIENAGGAALIEFCRCCGWRVSATLRASRPQRMQAHAE